VAQAKFTDIAILALPLRTRFRRIQTREVAIFRGKRWAEFSPFLEYGDEEASQWLRAALSWANDPLPELERKSINVNATLPAVPIDQISSTLASFGNFKTMKIKVADTKELSEDLARVRKVRELFPDVKIRLDANGALDVDSALFMAKQLKTINLEYFEQPVATIPELKNLKQQLEVNEISLKIAADESIRKAQDPLRVAQENAADIAVIKVQPLGGIDKALKIAQESGLEIVVSSALESSIGIAQGLHLAGALPELNYDCGLATAALLAADVTSEPLLPINGAIEIREVEPSQELIEKYAVSEDRKHWWLDRIERCLKLLES
jgi:O-succinylbenzoate synthase